MYQFEKIKLVIWDMDETFWHGTISEGSIVIPEEHTNLLRMLTDAGIVNSICSKNDYETVMKYLEEKGLAEYFVFPSINWSAKGQRILQLISDMQLRPANVLFLDDNPSNLEEALYFCKDLMTAGPKDISQLILQARTAEKKDLSHARLKQYRVLEEKNRAKETFSSNEEFLYESNIRVDIGYDCLAKITRIHDLIIRSNQLNFTKVRSTPEELQETLEDPSVQSGYVSVRDKFGDYGIAGFYAMKDGKLLHFVFSCRILGMGIEQYVYCLLNRPALEFVGEVISDLSCKTAPGWINQEREDTSAERMEIKSLTAHSVLMKGPCDLFQIYPFIANTELFDTEFTYTLPNGLVIESTGHTTNIVEAIRLTDEQKQRVLSEVPFTDAGMYCNNISKYNYNAVFISILTDCNFGVYRRKETGEQFACLEYAHPLTDERNWQGLIDGTYYNANIPFTENILRDFAKKYEFVGRNTPEQIVENLNYIRMHLPKSCILGILMGSELYYEKNTFDSYRDRHIVHKNANDALRAWAKGQPNVRLLDVNLYLKDQRGFYNHFNHYSKPVYFALSKMVVDIANEAIGGETIKTSGLKKLRIYLKSWLKRAYAKFRGGKQE